MAKYQTTNCVFCGIVAGTEPASILYEDEHCIAFMGIRPARPGECMIIPKQHVDHFTDLPDDAAAHIAVTGNRIGRQMLDVLKPKPQRIGFLVHGFGIAHAHYIIVPQHEADDLVSGRHLAIRQGKIVADETLIPLIARPELDAMAALLKIEKPT